MAVDCCLRRTDEEKRQGQGSLDSTSHFFTCEQVIAVEVGMDQLVHSLAGRFTVQTALRLTALF